MGIVIFFSSVYSFFLLGIPNFHGACMYHEKVVSASGKVVDARYIALSILTKTK